MKKVALGKTGFVVNKNGFGALPIQRISKEDAAYLLRKAFDNGITYFDTARFYTDSEETGYKSIWIKAYKDLPKYDANGNMVAIYLANEFGGFAVHLVQAK